MNITSLINNNNKLFPNAKNAKEYKNVISENDL